VAIEGGEHLLPGDPGRADHCHWNLHFVYIVSMRTIVQAYRPRRMRSIWHFIWRLSARILPVVEAVAYM
jgi:hypothetical protein